jgi:hypothetical protein
MYMGGTTSQYSGSSWAILARIQVSDMTIFLRKILFYLELLDQK